MVVSLTVISDGMLICKEESLVALSGSNIVDGSFPIDYKRMGVVARSWYIERRIAHVCLT